VDGGSVRGRAIEIAPLASGEFTPPRSAVNGARVAPGRGAAGLTGEEAGSSSEAGID